MSEPHIDEFAVNFPYLYSVVCRAVNHLPLLFCAFLHHLLIQNPFTKFLYSTTCRDESGAQSTSSMDTGIRAIACHKVGKSASSVHATSVYMSCRNKHDACANACCICLVVLS